MKRSDKTGVGADPAILQSVAMGTVAGSLALVMYLARTFLPLPDTVATWCYMFFGPSLVLAFLGWWPLMRIDGALLRAQVATVFGIIAGATNMMFAVVLRQKVQLRRPGRSHCATPSRARCAMAASA